MTNLLHQWHQRQRLRQILLQIELFDTDYPVRHTLVLEAMAAAHQAGYLTGYRLDPQEPDWPVAFIQLPTGQVSWHMPAFPEAWDGHDSGAKFDRIRAFCKKEKPR